MSRATRFAATAVTDSCGEPGQDVPAEHSGGSGDQPDGAHSAALSFSGSHQARLSRYHCTVSARPVRKSLRGS